MTFGEFVFLECPVVTGGVVTDIAVESLLLLGLIPEHLSPWALLLIGSSLSFFELFGSIGALTFVVVPAVFEVLSFFVLGNPVQFFFIEFQFSCDAFFERVVRTSAIVSEGVQRPGAQVIETVIMVPVIHCPEITSKDCFECKEDDAIDGNFACRRDWT